MSDSEAVQEWKHFADTAADRPATHLELAQAERLKRSTATLAELVAAIDYCEPVANAIIMPDGGLGLSVQQHRVRHALMRARDVLGE